MTKLVEIPLSWLRPLVEAAAVDELAGMMTEGPVTEEYRAMARAQLAALPVERTSTTHPTLTRSEVTDDIKALAAAARIQAREMKAEAASVGVALADRITALVGRLETLAFDAETLVLDLDQGNYPGSLAPDAVRPKASATDQAAE